MTTTLSSSMASRLLATTKTPLNNPVLSGHPLTNIRISSSGEDDHSFLLEEG
jgi:hypothetical protein